MTFATTDEYVKAVYGIDGVEERRVIEARTDRTDLDETRRLLYMVLLGGLSTERWYNLAGTLVNALAHHSKLASADQAIDRLRYMHDCDNLSLDDREWVQGLIDQITGQLADG